MLNYQRVILHFGNPVLKHPMLFFPRLCLWLRSGSSPLNPSGPLGRNGTGSGMECCNGFVDSVNPLDPKDPKWQKSAEFGPDKDCLVVKFLFFSIIFWDVNLPIDELHDFSRWLGMENHPN